MAKLARMRVLLEQKKMGEDSYKKKVMREAEVEKRRQEKLERIRRRQEERVREREREIGNDSDEAGYVLGSVPFKRTIKGKTKEAILLERAEKIRIREMEAAERKRLADEARKAAVIKKFAKPAPVPQKKPLPVKPN